MSEIIKGKRLGCMGMLPAAPGTCPECAVKHDPEQPHNQQSLFYQYHFFNEHGKWPTWKDAMEHCPEDIKKLWVDALKEQGVDVDANG